MNHSSHCLSWALRYTIATIGVTIIAICLPHQTHQTSPSHSISPTFCLARHVLAQPRLLRASTNTLPFRELARLLEVWTLGGLSRGCRVVVLSFVATGTPDPNYFPYDTLEAKVYESQSMRTPSIKQARSHIPIASNQRRTSLSTLLPRTRRPPPSPHRLFRRGKMGNPTHPLDAFSSPTTQEFLTHCV